MMMRQSLLSLFGRSGFMFKCDLQYQLLSLLEYCVMNGSQLRLSFVHLEGKTHLESHWESTLLKVKGHWQEYIIISSGLMHRKANFPTHLTNAL